MLIPCTPPKPTRPLADDTNHTPSTPRRRKAPKKHTGILPQSLSIPQLKDRLKATLDLKFTLEDCTGYGKSLNFEGLAALSGMNKLVIVICPLKSLEQDQAKSATAKGIEAIAINEDTTKTADGKLSEFLKTLEGYKVPMLSLIVDEAHCVDEWGGDDFCPEYQKLEHLSVSTASCDLGNRLGSAHISKI
ncbi:hypothetical protein BDP27DRAFT_1440735 [Rhodocollybia butyracea]|uniref:Helicase ATP-binding domain-containing protein n=1 Tax=Rhodocollybia butyracea TaxID=206335 RepID=A0A9P5TVH9_9AGAR|nr:hypothetical protein BDP27DRAFT_1440735 [Rhodocollybia butyracea]